ncbi:YdeI/OmpD-associated family protein [Chitinophaga sp.]|uniref:YdeI/OmpD-associated family protein n=1 Tax=Chitinophaga sp. TaxID=1869181 RepID=UPI0031CE561E
MEAVTFCPSNRQEWRQWLQENHDSAQSVWLVYYKKQANRPTITWSDAVDEALCFGWIDSTARTIDEERFMQFFTRRKANSVWSRINKEKIKRLTAAGLMTAAGKKCIDLARKNGSWSILDDVEDLKIPKDLEKAFKEKRGSKAHFKRLSKSTQKIYLQKLVLAKRPETRLKRIQEIVNLGE